MTTTIAMPIVHGVDHTFVNLPDGRMHVATLGTGDPVVLLSGFSQTWWEWREVMPALATAGFQAIAPDLRGEGWSELPFDAISRTQRAEDVLALLDVLGHGQVKLVSHDMGAITAYQLALDFPDRVSAQVILAVPPPQLRFSPDMGPGMRHLWHQEVLAVPVLGPALLREGHLPQQLFSRFSARTLNPDVLALYIALLRDIELSRAAAPLCRRMVLPELGRIVRGTYRRERFAMPSLFIFGTADIGFPPDITRKVFADTTTIGSDVRLALVEGSGHFVVDEDPDATTALIVDFFATA
ncbi:alpha/beta hydrolase [Arthrobacter sp. 260]|uniref:alpha/beta fold hydrolase n=1 Tax=Arthrobacter sp. 260 TaxID=2735314 RepID=UPI0014927E63|nr:alpha/beta hydrolase [Arthrobacter sp. 260]NOJ61544.1 alpha/beta hydrolase [Arthrobacter sp. 260]